ncbi:spermidine coumaroyl-coa acyltransferase [Quercus suber]|uniref:Spermidine coumaroyl-coa acyltransferase n=1 Tax=Quercus suber TaxID=58331 RepID=A0AAW0M5L0_QUESU
MSLTEEFGTENLYKSFTTIEVLGAYIWRSRFRALKLNSDGKTNFRLVMGIRNMIGATMAKFKEEMDALKLFQKKFY